MRMRVRLLLGLGIAASVSAAVPAVADDAEVVATPGNQFMPRTVTIRPGDQVVWRNQGGFHNVHFDDEGMDEPANPSPASWTVNRRFPHEGTFNYYCEAHGRPGGQGMAGTVVVSAASDPPRESDTQAPSVSDLAVAPRRFCNRRTRRCRRRGTRIRFTLSEAGAVEIRIRPLRGGRPTDSVSVRGSNGANSIRYSGRRLRLGRYRLTVTARDDAGNTSAAASTTFRVARSR